MTRQARQADLRRRMAEARSKLQISASSVCSQVRDDNERILSRVPLIPSTTCGILRKSKYTSDNLDHLTATAKKDVSNGGPSENSALGGLIGGYTSSGDDEEMVVSRSEVFVSAEKKMRASITLSSKDTTRNISTNRAKFDPEKSGTHTSSRVKAGSSIARNADESVFDSNCASHEDFSVKFVKISNEADEANLSSKETISEEVWNEFNSLIDGDHGRNVTGEGGEGAEKTVSVDIKLNSEQSAPTHTAASAEVTVRAKKRKRKNKLEEIKETSYDIDAVTNAEQVSYEARLARLMLLKSRMHNKKTDVDTNGNSLKSLDFYDPSLAFQEDDDDIYEPDFSQDIKSKEASLNDYSLEQPLATPTSMIQSTSRNPLLSSNTFSGGSNLSISTILKKRRNQVRQMSACVEDSMFSIQDSEDSLTDGRWF